MDAAWEQIRRAVFGLSVSGGFLDLQHCCARALRLGRILIFIDLTRLGDALLAKLFPISALAVFYN